MTRMRKLTRTGAASAALGSLLLIAACGSDNGNGTTSQGGAGGVSSDLEEVYDTNPVDREDLQVGGQFTVPIGNFGPNWNQLTNVGNSAGVAGVANAMHTAGAWDTDAEGNYVLNEDFVLDVDHDIVDGVQILEFELNPDAVFNDGTPIDAEVYEHTLWIRSGAANEEFDQPFDLISTNMYDQVDSFEIEDDWNFTVTLEEPYQPWQTLFSRGILHPDINTPEIFNDGFLGDVQEDWRAGPFIPDIVDSASNVISLVRNENWWGEPALLDRLNFVLYDAQADIQAYQNGEIDTVELNNLERFDQMANWQEPGVQDWDMRSGQNLAHGGFLINVDNPETSDPAVREAIFRGIDREQLIEVNYQGLDWEEDPNGSYLLMSFDENFEDPYPVEDADPEGAREVLEEAGYVMEEGDDYFTDPETGEELVVSLMTFGNTAPDSPVNQSFQTMIRQTGINLEITNRPADESSEAIDGQEYAVLGLTYGAGADPTGGLTQMFSTGSGNTTAGGDEEIDELISEASSIEDRDERVARVLEIEAMAIERYFHYLGIWSGPEIMAVRPGLANYGPQLFETMNWADVGWEVDADDDGTGTGADVDELEDDDE